jgi:predicted nucleic acid-binding protein
VAVASRKLRRSLIDIHEVLAPIRAVRAVEPVTIETHDRAQQMAEREGLSIRDALIGAAALLAGRKALHPEDLPDSKGIERQLTIRNPFAAP